MTATRTTNGNKKRGTRKSRRLRFSSASFIAVRFEPSREVLDGIVHALGVRFTHADSKRLTAVVETYFKTHPFETAAPFVDDAQGFLNQLLRSARSFQTTLLSSPSSEAQVFVQTAITQAFFNRSPKPPMTWPHVISVVAEFITASELAGAIIDRARTDDFIEGAAWRKLIRDLTRFCKRRKWPTAAAKSDVKKPSRFVEFVWELQGAFPVKLRRHNSSHGALAKAIAEVRKRRLPGR